MKGRCFGVTRMIQAVIAQKQFEYNEIPLEQYEGYCYSFKAVEDFVLIPDGNIHILYDVNNRSVMILGKLIEEGQNKVLFMEGNGHSYFGVSLSNIKKYSTREEVWKQFVEGLKLINDFADFRAYIDMNLSKYIIIQTNHSVVSYTMKNIIKSQGNATIESIADEQDYTVRQLERIFKEYYGCSPKDMSRFARMGFVLEAMLKHPEYSFATIAKKYRFSDPSHFLREFKRYFVMTPKEFAIKYFHKKYTN